MFVSKALGGLLALSRLAAALPLDPILSNGIDVRDTTTTEESPEPDVIIKRESDESLWNEGIEVRDTTTTEESPEPDVIIKRDTDEPDVIIKRDEPDVLIGRDTDEPDVIIKRCNQEVAEPDCVID